MSDIITFIQVAPHPADWENKPEVLQVVKTCPMCKGVGNFKKRKGYHGSLANEFLVTDCIRCKGSGKLKADIVIRWTPNEVITE